MRMLPTPARRSLGPTWLRPKLALRLTELRLTGLMLLLPLPLLLPPSSATAQQPPKTTAATPTAEPADLSHLPVPLEDISSNILELERNGILRVENVRFVPAGSVYGRDNSIVWTLRTRRHVTCRHLELLLQAFVDVRIYEATDYGTSLLYQTLLVYPDRIHAGAIDGRILAPGEYLDVWIQLRDTNIRMLSGLNANRMIAGPTPRKLAREQE